MSILDLLQYLYHHNGRCEVTDLLAFIPLDCVCAICYTAADRHFIEWSRSAGWIELTDEGLDRLAACDADELDLVGLVSQPAGGVA